MKNLIISAAIFSTALSASATSTIYNDQTTTSLSEVESFTLVDNSVVSESSIQVIETYNIDNIENIDYIDFYETKSGRIFSKEDLKLVKLKTGKTLKWLAGAGSGSDTGGG